VDASIWHEVVGYVASAIVVLSLMMKSILRLRLIGLAGSLAFFAYGVLIGSIPIAITNVVIMGIHLFFLRKLLGSTEIFSTLRVNPESRYLQRFLEFHAEQIERFQPGFAYSPVPETLPVFILRDMIPAGLLVTLPHADGSLEVQLDYATPQYRDFKLGRFVYSIESAVFGDPTCAWSDMWSEAHTHYLERMGFRRGDRDGRTVMQRPLGGDPT
jgi:hypothetical protein